MADLKLYFDGACEPINPGGTGTYGFVILRCGEVIDVGRGSCGRGPGTTNNISEYAAITHGLERMIALGLNEGQDVEVFGDSKLVVEQVCGRWRINKPHLRLHVESVRELLSRFPSWTLTWVPREQNEQADEQSRIAYQEVTGEEFPTRRAVSYGR
jgi:ribonuclease HI